MNYRVAIVDDEPEIIERISALLKKYPSGGEEKISFEPDTYTNGEEFLNKYDNGYEIIFLDVNMPGPNGLSVAKAIREKNKSVIIIFCTNYGQYAVNGYEVGAFGYILKPVEEASFNRNLDRALKFLKSKQSRKIRVKTLHGVEVVSVSDILYLEIQIHNLFYYVLEGDNVIDYRTRGSMQDSEDCLGGLGFARCSACYLVNLNHVLSVKNGEVHLKGNITLPISRKFLRSFSDSFIKYLGNSGTINV